MHFRSLYSPTKRIELHCIRLLHWIQLMNVCVLKFMQLYELLFISFINLATLSSTCFWCFSTVLPIKPKFLITCLSCPSWVVWLLDIANLSQLLGANDLLITLPRNSDFSIRNLTEEWAVGGIQRQRLRDVQEVFSTSSLILSWDSDMNCSILFSNLTSSVGVLSARRIQKLELQRFMYTENTC